MRCEVCGKGETNDKIFNYRKYNMRVCTKHRNQLARYGKITDTNKYIEYIGECCICGITDNDIKIIASTKHQGNYCRKHYSQLQNYGKIFNRTKFEPNKIVKYDTYAEIILYNKNHEEVARTKIDLEDISKIKKYKWHISEGYVKSDTTGKKTAIHRVIMDCPEDMVVDHINHDTLDNRKSNLRICSQAQNIMNQKIRRDNISGIKGVRWQENSRKWLSQICIRGNNIYLGLYENKKEAIKAREKAENKYFGEYAFNEGG